MVRSGLLLLLALGAAPGRAEPAAVDAPPADMTATPPPAPTATAFPSLTSVSETERWERHLRGFRREHNFALTVGASSGTWHVKDFGGVTHRDFPSNGVYSRFQYTYHIPLYEGFGYFLGSSFGYEYETGDIARGFRPSPAIGFPGVVAGLVMNLSPVFRFSVAGDVDLERYNNVQEHSATDDREISITTNTYDAGAFLDVFYRLNWAVRLEAHRRHVDYEAPQRDPSSPQAYPVDATLSKDERWFGLGLVYHLL